MTLGQENKKNKKDRIDETNKWATSSIRHLHESGHLRNVKQRWNFEDPNEVAKVISRASICVNMAKQKQGGKKTKKSKRSSNGAGKRRKKQLKRREILSLPIMKGGVAQLIEEEWKKIKDEKKVIKKKKEKLRRHEKAFLKEQQNFDDYVEEVENLRNILLDVLKQCQKDARSTLPVLPNENATMSASEDGDDDFVFSANGTLTPRQSKAAPKKDVFRC